MKKFTITIERTSVEEFTVEAENAEDAQNKAMEEAVNTNWASFEADYKVLD
jgi:predicted secreted protein